MGGGDDSEVLHRWFETCHRLGVTLQAATVMGARLADAYTESHRAYHDLGHVRHVLDLVATLRLADPLQSIVELTLWFHDVIYDPSRSDNELASAQLAQDWMTEQGLADGERVAELIMVTASHEKAVGGDRAAAVVHDVDLAILGSPPHEYARYVEAVRVEYGWLDDETFRAGRRSVLERFVRTDPLYLTAELAPVLEKQARANLQAELDSLV